MSMMRFTNWPRAARAARSALSLGAAAVFAASTVAAALTIGATTASVAAAADDSGRVVMSRAPEDNLFFATSTEPLCLDPALIDDIDSGNMVSNLYESLLRFKQGSMELEPSLATSWEISPDGKVYTFHLRQGVVFHDGTPFNAAAVKFNFDRQSRENATAKMSYAELVFGEVKSTEVVDEYTVRVTLKRPYTPFLNNMAMAYGAAIASPTAIQKYNNDLSDHPVGTGPYRLVSWDKGQQLVLTTNNDYWGEKPKVQNLIVRVMKETSARVVALNNGEVDLINGIDANVIGQIQSMGNKIFEGQGNTINYMIFNCREGVATGAGPNITSDQEIRRAIVQAIDVESLVKSLYQGYAERAVTFEPKFMAGYSPDIKPIAYDPKAAQETLQQRGITELTIITYSNARSYNSVGGQVLAEAVQSYLAKVGVQATVEVYDWATFKNKLLTSKWNLAFTGWSGDNGDPDNFINFLAAAEPVLNNGMWLSPNFQKLVAQGVTVPNGPERAKVYQEAEKIIIKEAAVLPLSHAKSIWAYRPVIDGELCHPIGFNYFSRISKTAAP